MTEYAREVLAASHEEGVGFRLRDPRTRSRGVLMDADELRWLCYVAGPALLAQHAPLPGAADRMPPPGAAKGPPPPAQGALGGGPSE